MAKAPQIRPEAPTEGSAQLPKLRSGERRRRFDAKLAPNALIFLNPER